MKGFVQIYTGNGKGKTTAAIGLAIRAAGADLKVFIAQFLKKGDYRLAREYYSSALELYQESGDKMGLANIYFEMAN